MLFAKDFKTAVAVVIAVAGLLSFGTANATVLLSEDNAVGEDASTPAFFAAELYPGTLSTTTKTVGAVPVATTTNANALGVEVGDLAADGMSGGVDISLLDGDRYFVRFDFTNGATFGDNFTGVPLIRRGPDDTAELRNTTELLRGGSDGDDHGIWTFTVNSASATADTAGGADTEVDGTVTAGHWTVEIGRNQLGNGGVRVPRSQSAIERSCYSLRFRLFDSSANARNARDELVDASGTLLCYVPTISASVTAPQTLTASVSEGFRRFVGASPASGRLATANVTVAKMVACGSACAKAKMLPVQNPADGMDFDASDVLKEVEFSLTGSFTHSSPFGFGEFKLGTATMDRIGADGDVLSAAENTTAAGKAGTTKVMGTVTAAGTFPITVDVSGNNAASATNVYEAIGQGSYEAALEIDQVDPGDDQGTAMDPAGRDEMKAGTIERDGTTVRVGYLQTITELERDGDIIGWNQRLVITNHGSISADVMLSEFNAEDGAEVTCKMPAGNNVVDGEGKWSCGDNGEVNTTIGANSQLVLRVADMIEGASRTSAMVTIAQDSSQISVASTHVTLPGGQTDTVLYWPLQ